MATELIPIEETQGTDARLAVCYARGSVFKPEGKFFRIEKGKRTLVSRALCMNTTFSQCPNCPNYHVKLKLAPVHRG